MVRRGQNYYDFIYRINVVFLEIFWYVFREQVKYNILIKRKLLMIHSKNSYVALILLASIATLSMQASSKKNPPATTKPAPQPKPKYVIPSKPGPINFVTPNPGERTHPRLPRGKR